MLFQNMIIGYDKYGKPLKCGDVCKYKVTHKENGVTNEYHGMVVYDSSEYAFMFEQLQDDFPLIFMSLVNRGTIEYLYTINAETIGNIPDGEDWREIYNNNCGQLK